MKVHDFGRIRGSKIKIGERTGQPLGLVDGSQVFSTMFRYQFNGKGSYEIVLSTFGPENYREICTLTFYMLDTPGACASVAKFLGQRNIDILNSVSLSMISNVTMVWRMLVDLSYFGDQAALREEFDTLKRQKAMALQKVDAMEIEASNISERFTKGLVVPGVQTKAVRKTGKTPSIIRDGEFEVPAEYLKLLEGVKDGDPVMMVSDADSWVLSLTFLDPALRLMEIEFNIPDKPGAIYEITDALSGMDINLLSVSTKVLVYYDRMTLGLITDVSRCKCDQAALKAELEGLLGQLKGKYELVRYSPIGF
jgi:predicted amino acid-binding ACT domain protein